MNHHRIDLLLAKIKDLERELVQEGSKKEAEFCYSVHQQKVKFTEAARSKHRLLKLHWHRYLVDSACLTLLTAPVIWMCLIPLLLMDIAASLYQAICFPVYGIPKAKRADYLNFDRHRLGYLNFFEKLNCEYCAYANGILSYFTEIAARTEQHWCPIKHAGCLKCAHSRYKNFVEYGDAEGYRQELEAIRHSFQDIPPSKLPEDPASR